MIGPHEVFKAITRHCQWCSNSAKEVPLCPATSCPLWVCREGQGASKSIVAAKCQDCNPEGYKSCTEACALAKINHSLVWKKTKTRSCIDVYE